MSNAKERAEAARTRAAAMGIETGEGFGLDWVEAEPRATRHVSDEKVEPVSAADFLAEIDRVATKHGLRPNRDELLSEAIAEGRVILTDEERVVEALASKVAKRLGRS